MNNEKPVYLGIEIGGSKLPIVLGHASGHILERCRFHVDASAGAQAIRDKIEGTLQEWRLKFRLAGVGVGFGGPVNWKTRQICRSHQIEGWSDFALGSWLESLVDAPVVVENDANTAALGEALVGAGQGGSRVFYITLGSGVGGGMVVDRAIYHGALPGEAEVGHLRLDRQGTTVESQCSGWAVDAKIRARIRQGGSAEGLLAELVRSAPVPGGEARFLAASLGVHDPMAIEILDEWADDLAFALSHVSHLFHPEIIVMGGGLALLGEPLRLAVAKALPQHLMEVFAPGPEIRLAKLKEDAVPTGALLLAGRAEKSDS